MLPALRYGLAALLLVAVSMPAAAQREEEGGVTVRRPSFVRYLVSAERLETLKLTDDEVAVVMGHEIAHALREHARARSAKATLTQVGAVAIGFLFGDGYGQIAQQGGGLFNLKFNRDDERDADLIGLELAARAGHNPEAGIALWEKMAQVQRGAPPVWLSTHPTSADRIARMKKALPKVMPLYEKARLAKQ